MNALDRLRALRARLGSVLTHARDERDFDEELEAHLELAIEENVRHGMTVEDARRQALVRLGGLQQARETHHDARGLPFLDRTVQDLRFTRRALVREPWFTATAVLILAIGIGANTAIFGLVRAVILQPLPFAAPERLVWIVNGKSGHSQAELSAVTHMAGVWDFWRRHSQQFDDIAAYNAFFAYDSYRLTGSGEPARLGTVQVSQNFLTVLGIAPHIGRFFTDAEMLQGGPRAIVLSHALWRRQFAADPSIVGSSVVIDGKGATVVGVLPATFDFSSVFSPATRVDFLSPLVFEEVKDWGNTVSIVGRLRADSTMAAAQREIDALSARLKREQKDLPDGFEGGLSPLSDEVSGRTRRAVFLLWTAVGAVLLIACANLSSLLMTRASGRRHEFVVRAALGASRGRLVLLLLTESLVLSAMGAILGIAGAHAIFTRLSMFEDLAIPLVQRTGLDAFVMAFTATVTIATAALVGIWPGLTASRVDLNEALKAGARGMGSRGQRRLTSTLVVTEIALACGLLVIAGLLTRSLYRVLDVDLGFRPDEAIAVKVDPVGTSSLAERMAYFDEALRRVRALPAVAAAGVSDTLPLDRNRSWGIKPKERFPNSFEGYEATLVSRSGPGYLGAMGISLIKGRDFTDRDDEKSASVVIVNSRLAQAFWPGSDARDREVIINNFAARVIGVVADVRHGSPEQASGHEIYLPMTQRDASTVDLVVRGRARPAALAADVRTTLAAFDPTLPLNDIRPVRYLVDRAVSSRRFFAVLLIAFAVMALLLASLGIYGVVSRRVIGQQREIGLRLALGAMPRQVRRRLIAETVSLAAIGILIGIAAALAGSRVMGALVFGVSAVDPLTFIGVPVVLACVAVVAGTIPAWRAGRVDPMRALREI